MQALVAYVGTGGTCRNPPPGHPRPADLIWLPLWKLHLNEQPLLFSQAKDGAASSSRGVSSHSPLSAACIAARRGVEGGHWGEQADCAMAVYWAVEDGMEWHCANQRLWCKSALWSTSRLLARLPAVQLPDGGCSPVQQVYAVAPAPGHLYGAGDATSTCARCCFSVVRVHA